MAEPNLVLARHKDGREALIDADALEAVYSDLGWSAAPKTAKKETSA